jgi:hypothetical protein
MGTRYQAPCKVLTVIIHQKDTTSATVTKQEGVIEQREAKKTKKDTWVMKVTNRPTTIIMGKTLVQEERNMSRHQRRKGVKRNLTTQRILTGPSMTSMNMGDTEPSIRNTTSTRKKDSPRYGIFIPYSVLRQFRSLF